MWGEFFGGFGVFDGHFVAGPEADEEEHGSEGHAHDGEDGGELGGGGAFGGGGGEGSAGGGGGEGGKSGEHGAGEGVGGVGAVQRGFDKGEHFCVEELSATGEALLDGLFGEAESVGDLGDGVFLTVEKDKRFAVELGDLREGAPKERLFLVRHGLGVGRERRGRGRAEKVGGREKRMFAEGVAAGGVDEIAGDAAQPGAELGGLAKFGQLFPGGDEDVLRDVLAMGDAAGGGVGEGADERLVTLDDGASKA